MNGIAIDASDVIQIAILYLVFYAILKSAKGSRFGQALMGFGLLAALLTAFAYLFHFDVLTRIVQFLLVYIAVSTVVIFQPEIRRILEQMGSRRFMAILTPTVSAGLMEQMISQTVLACSEMSQSRTGALIVFEREMKLDELVRSGTVLDASVSGELLKNRRYWSFIHTASTPLRSPFFFS